MPQPGARLPLGPLSCPQPTWPVSPGSRRVDASGCGCGCGQGRSRGRGVQALPETAGELSRAVGTTHQRAVCLGDRRSALRVTGLGRGCFRGPPPSHWPVAPAHLLRLLGAPFPQQGPTSTPRFCFRPARSVLRGPLPWPPPTQTLPPCRPRTEPQPGHVAARSDVSAQLPSCGHQRGVRQPGGPRCPCVPSHVSLAATNPRCAQLFKTGRRSCVTTMSPTMPVPHAGLDTTDVPLDKAGRRTVSEPSRRRCPVAPGGQCYGSPASGPAE